MESDRSSPNLECGANCEALGAALRYEAHQGIKKISPLGEGLINDTFLVESFCGPWVLQRINRHVFRDPAAVMANLRKILDHAMASSSLKSDQGLQLPMIIKTREGLDYSTFEDGSVWRAMTFLESTRTLKVIRKPEEAREVGRALGWFHALMADLDPSDLQDPIPGFHDVAGYLERWDRSMLAPCRELDDRVRRLVDFIDTRRDRLGVLRSALDSGDVGVFVTHGDPKLDNVLFFEGACRAASLIDLDTVKAGLLHHDLGDCFRSSCNTGRERGHEAVAFDAVLFEAVLAGYLSEALRLVSSRDLEYVYEATWLLPFELGLRFLTDHLEGDVYFKASHTGHNLERAERQFDLVRSIEAQQGLLYQVLRDLLPP